MLADGMGGHNAGEVASALAVETASDFLSGRPCPYTPDDLHLAAHAANQAVYLKSISDPLCEGMGTTFELLHISDESYYLIHIGDSRTYLYRNGAVRRLTRDHSTLQQLKDMGIQLDSAQEENLNHSITRCVGISKEVEFDVCSDNLHHGDTFVVCSDGLSDYLSDGDLLSFLSGLDGLEMLASQMVQAALERGGEDNITVVLVRFGSKNDGRGKEPRPTRPLKLKTATR
jgi:protein phosphatase